ncbi:MAG: hypothetical protein II694_10050 [Lachnospiraceae bacterium]|nr:hypothetical protein [Lachnospiraceae bacterium]
MVMKLLEFRTLLLKIYQKARFIINPIIKFFLSTMVFNWINSEIGYDQRFASKTIVLLLSAICAVTPGGVLVFLAMVLMLVHVFHASILLAALLFLMFVVLYGLLMRFAPEEALAAVAVPVLAKYNLHYCVPMVLGCIATPLSMLPCACGVIIWYLISIVKNFSGVQVNIKNLDEVISLYTGVVDAFLANKQMLITIAVFALVITAIFIIRRFSFDFAFVVSIGAGVLVNILGFLVAVLHFNVSINAGKLILMSLISGVIAVVLEFFKRVLDYTAIERVQFEDDDYYYYVKAVPKVNVSIPRHNVKRMSDYGDDEEPEETPATGSYAAFGNDDFDAAEDEEEDIRIAEPPKKKNRFAFNRSDYIKEPAPAASKDSEIRYEEFDDSDFDDAGTGFDDEIIRYDRDEDMSSYGMKNIGPADDDKPGDDGDYETWMTLDDDDNNN